MPHVQFPCILFKQRTEEVSPDFVVFVAPVGDILSWAAIRRREDDPEGPQRRLSKSKIGAIRRFFEQDSRNTIPPAITLTLKIEENNLVPIPGLPDVPQGVDRLHVLTIDIPDETTDEEKPGLVIDGQHRLLGTLEYDQDCLVTVVALLNVPDSETAFQFLVINNKVTRVPSDLLRTLALDYQEHELADRLSAARLTLDENLRFVGIVDADDASPFRNLLTLVNHQGDQADRYVAPAAIENSIAQIRDRDIRELRNDDALIDFFFCIWSRIRDTWPELWNRDSKLMHKVSIVAMTTFVADAVIAKFDWDPFDISDVAAVSSVVDRVLMHQTKDFWTSEWKIKISDAKAVRDKIVEALTKISRNMRSEQIWNEDVDIVIF